MRAERAKVPQGKRPFRISHSLIVLVYGLTFIACGGALRQVQGAKFALNGQEESLAEEYSQGEPVSADSSARCEYWKGRTAEAGNGHAVGVLVWRADHFQTLKSWTNAKAVEVCTLAKAEQKRQEEVATREREAAANLRRQEEERHASEQRERQTAREAAAKLAREAEAVELTKRMAEQRRVSDVASLGSLERGLASFGSSPKWTNDSLDRMVELSRIIAHLSAADTSLVEAEKARLAIATKAMGNLTRSQSYIKASNADRARQQALEARRQLQPQAETVVRTASVRDILVDPNSFIGVQVRIKNVVVSQRNLDTFRANGYVSDVQDGPGRSAINVFIASNAPTDVRRSWLNLPESAAVLPILTGVVRKNVDGLFLLIDSPVSAGASYD